MKKILIALGKQVLRKEAFKRESYLEHFREKGFKVLFAKDGWEALEIIRKKMPDLIIADIHLPKIGGLELMKLLRRDEKTKRIPVMIYSELGLEREREKALDLMALDFISGVKDSPSRVVAKVRSYFGEQRSYLILLQPDLEEAKRLAQDLGYRKKLTCISCKSPLSLQLLRDLSAGEKHFIVSFVCPKCQIPLRGD
jgi:CheY-like chemotaxis protein